MPASQVKIRSRFGKISLEQSFFELILLAVKHDIWPISRRYWNKCRNGGNNAFRLLGSVSRRWMIFVILVAPKIDCKLSMTKLAWHVGFSMVCANTFYWLEPVLEWLWVSAHGSQVSMIFPYAVPMLYVPPTVWSIDSTAYLNFCSPEILRMSELNDSSDLHTYSNAVLHILSVVSPPIEYVAAILSHFVTAIRSTTVRVYCFWGPARANYIFNSPGVQGSRLYQLWLFSSTETFCTYLKTEFPMWWRCYWSVLLMRMSKWERWLRRH